MESFHNLTCLENICIEEGPKGGLTTACLSAPRSGKLAVSLVSKKASHLVRDNTCRITFYCSGQLAHLSFCKLRISQCLCCDCMCIPTAHCAEFQRRHLPPVCSHHTAVHWAGSPILPGNYSGKHWWAKITKPSWSHSVRHCLQWNIHLNEALMKQPSSWPNQ